MSKAKTTKPMAGIKLPAVSIPDKAKKTIIPIPQDEIEQLNKMRNDKLIFSFRFLDKTHEAFNLGNTKENWYISLLDILKEVSSLTRTQLVVENRHFYEAHIHEWVKLDYKYDYSDDFLEQVECLQFRLSKSRGRVHGFIIGNRFYIVWLDPHHNLYPSEKHGGRKFYNNPLNCYDQLLAEHTELKHQCQELSELLEERTNPNR